MPVVVAIAIRYIIMAAVQLGLWTLLEKYGLPLLNNAVVAIMKAFGVSEDDAKAIMANKILVAFEEVGIFAATLRTKMPIKVAEYLGFTSKGYAVRKLEGSLASRIESQAVKSATNAVATTEVTAEVANVVAKSKGLQLTRVLKILGAVSLTVSIPTQIFYAFAQYIDYAAWQNPFQKFFTGIMGIFGIHPDTPLPNAKTISADNWKRIYYTIEELKPLGISYPFSNVDKQYSRQALADLIDEVAANMVKAGTQPTYKNVMAIVIPLLQFNGQEVSDAKIETALAKGKSVISTTQSAGTATQTVKVFTGIVSQGVVGAGLVFTARQDDMIDSVTELREAAANNLAPFLASLPSKVIYEVKVVSSITTKDGFKQTGTTQRIQTGTYANGTPKYKTVTNKFATLILYILTDKGTRTKLTTVVLGPVNSAKLTVQQNDLAELALSLPSIVTTTNIADITGIKTSEGITQVAQTIAPIKTEEIIKTTPKQTFGFTLARLINPGNTPTLQEEVGYAEIAALKQEFQTYFPNDVLGWANFSGNILNLRTKLHQYYNNNLDPAHDQNFKNYLAKVVQDLTSPVGIVSVVTPAKANAATTAREASTLYEWYQAQGQTLPSVSARAQIYASMGLGQASYYTGTTEQNTKLLAALKSGTNVATSSAASNTSNIVDNMYLQA